MNKTVRLAALVVLALALTCLCLAQPGFPHKIPHPNCVPKCAHSCRSLGMLTYQTCKSCYCYLPTPVGCDGGCSGCSGYSGCEGGCYGGCYGGCDGGCGGGGGCGGCGD
jgi:hypothetical protein